MCSEAQIGRKVPVHVHICAPCGLHRMPHLSHVIEIKGESPACALGCALAGPWGPDWRHRETPPGGSRGHTCRGQLLGFLPQI